MKVLRRILIYLSLAILVVIIALTASVFLFKDRIINQFIREANKQLNTPVTVGKIDISLFEDFPQLSIVLHDVYVEDSHPGKYPLLTAKKISFQMNPIEVWNGNYNIKGVQVSDSETNLKIDEKGSNNYTIVKSSTQSGGVGTVKFELKNVGLINTKINYRDIKARQDMSFTSNELIASIATSNDIYTIEAFGDVFTDKIQIEGNTYLTGKRFKATSEVIYDDEKKHLTIQPTILELNHAAFNISGTYSWKTRNVIDLITEGKDTDIQTLLSLMPDDISKKFEKYKSKGDVYFTAKLKGQISKTKDPSLTVDFGFKNATIFHPDYKAQIEDATLTGSFASSEVTDPRQATIVLKDISGKLNDENFNASFVLNNFSKPEVICDFKGRVDAHALMNFYPIQEISEVSGNLLADVAFEGQIELLKNKATAQKVYTRGTVQLQNINFNYGKNQVPLQNLNGDLQFNNNDLALSNVSGKLGNSDFVLNGFFKNIITFLLFENQPIGIETDLKSKYLDVDQLFELGFGDDESEQEYTFSISPNIYLNFNCDVDFLRYKRFKGRALKGDLLVKNEVAVSRNLKCSAMGGQITMSGIVDAKNHKAIDVINTFKVSDVNVDSVFYVFENFHQSFIEDKHLKGKATAEVNLEMTLNEHLKLFQETLIGDISAVIKNGELNNFEPLQKLNRYLDDEGLSRLRFSDLKNDIHIEKRTVYIPQMDIRSNVTDLKVSGTHTFDQNIEYHIVTPLRRKKITDTEAQGAIEETGQGQTKLFLKIVGTTDEYKISYDTDAVKKKLASDFKKEVQELKDAFKSKGKKKQKEVELEKDEYFDW